MPSKLEEANPTRNYAASPESYERQPGESSAHYYSRRLIAIKPIEVIENQAMYTGLNRILSVWDLIFIGIGGIIGAG